MEFQEGNDKKASIYKKQCCNKSLYFTEIHNSTNQPQQPSNFPKKLSHRLNFSWPISKTLNITKQNINLIKKKLKPNSEIFCFNIRNWFGESKHPNVNTSIGEPSKIYHFSQRKTLSPSHNCSITSHISTRHNNIPKSLYKNYQHNLYPNFQQRCINHNCHSKGNKSRLN